MRSISTLRRQKTYLLSKMAQDQLNGLAAMLIDRDIDLDYKAIISDFANKHPRKMVLKNILDSDSTESNQ